MCEFAKVILISYIIFFRFLYQSELGPSPFFQHFQNLLQNVQLDRDGDPNLYRCPHFIPTLLQHLLPQAPLWTGLLLGKSEVNTACPTK